MTDDRPDPKNPRQLTPEEAGRLDEAPIDYSDIPPLTDEFFAKARAMHDDDLPTPPLFGEDFYAATILDIVYRHCKAEDGLDSRGDRLRAELMMLCEGAGDIEIKDQFGWFITANLTAEGLNTLAALAEHDAQKRAREQKDRRK